MKTYEFEGSNMTYKYQVVNPRVTVHMSFLPPDFDDFLDDCLGGDVTSVSKDHYLVNKDAYPAVHETIRSKLAPMQMDMANSGELDIIVHAY